jgi:nucleoside-diphosphate-sugar epimerase
MRCLVTGAYGFIGAAVARALQREGFTVIGAGRDLDVARRIVPDIASIECDFNRDVEVADWLPRLEAIDIVVKQIRMRDLAEQAVAGGAAELPAAYHRLYRVWFWLGWPAFLAVLAIFWLMIAKPL